jgi:hypothetical protein
MMHPFQSWLGVCEDCARVSGIGVCCLAGFETRVGGRLTECKGEGVVSREGGDGIAHGARRIGRQHQHQQKGQVAQQLGRQAHDPVHQRPEQAREEHLQMEPMQTADQTEAKPGSVGWSIFVARCSRWCQWIQGKP